MLLLPYQKNWITDPNRFKIGIWARQSGKSTACAAEIVRDCLSQPQRDWIIISAGERQAVEFLAKVHAWARQTHEAATSEEPDADPRLDQLLDKLPRDSRAAAISTAQTPPTLRKNEITWANGSRAQALPANAKTIRGYSGNILLDEFAFYENPREIWSAIYPTITNSLSGGEKLIRIVTTPNGRNNRAFRIWDDKQSAAGRIWTRHLVTISEAQEQGLPVDLSILRAGLDDDVAWAQEFQCEFLDTNSATLLSSQIVAASQHPAAQTLCEWAEHPRATNPLSLISAPPDPPSPYPRKPPAPPPQHLPHAANLYVGFDFARYRDLSVIWVLERLWLPDDPLPVYLTREIRTFRRMSTPDQAAILAPRIRAARAAAIDATGPGLGLGDLLARDYGTRDPDTGHGGKVALCQFSAEFKRKIFSRLKTAMEQRRILIPDTGDDHNIREDLAAWNRIILPNGQVTYHAPQRSGNHADRIIALALALHIAETPTPAPHEKLQIQPIPHQKKRHSFP